MASLYSSLSNGGKTWKPQLVKRITNHIGETIFKSTPKELDHEKLIKDKNFALMRDILKMWSCTLKEQVKSSGEGQTEPKTGSSSGCKS